jgi:hypothetical protein
MHLIDRNLLAMPSSTGIVTLLSNILILADRTVFHVRLSNQIDSSLNNLLCIRTIASYLRYQLINNPHLVI